MKSKPAQCSQLATVLALQLVPCFLGIAFGQGSQSSPFPAFHGPPEVARKGHVSPSLAAFSNHRRQFVGGGSREVPNVRFVRQAEQVPQWVVYAFPGVPGLTQRWQMVRLEGDKLVVRVDSYSGGSRRRSEERRIDRLKIPQQSGREVVSIAGRKFNCKVFKKGDSTYWYSASIPILGLVRFQEGDGGGVMEMLRSSGDPGADF